MRRTRDATDPIGPMMTFDRNLIAEAVRLFEGQAISAAEADELYGRHGSREAFLGELLLRRGALARSFDLGEAVERARTTAALRDRAERRFYDALLEQLDPLVPTAIYVPRWPGVANATRSMFRQSIPIPSSPGQHPDDIDAAKIAAYADTLLAAGGRHFIVSGGDDFQLALIRSVLKQDPGIRFDFMWHANYLQMGEERDWRLFRQWIHAAETGLITRFGVVKAGLDEFLRHLNINAVFVPNFVPIDDKRTRANPVTDVAGIWLSGSSAYRKLPHAMIAAVKAMRSFYLKGAGLGVEGLALVSALDVPFLQVFEDVIPYEQLLREMAATAVSLYVTISECWPMLPLESFSVGVPCLVGPSSDLFRDHKFLHEMLVVDQPYNPGLIADMALAAVARGDDLLAAYRSYNIELETRMHDALARFLA